MESMNASPPLLLMTDVWREYRNGETTFAALRGIHLRIDAGEMVAIVGPSGSGKSTLMNLLGCLDAPTRGDYRVSGTSVTGVDSDDLARLRRERFGFVFQRYQLIGDLSAFANVEVPAVYAGMTARARRERIDDLFARLGLGDRKRHRPAQLSGGQQQRVSMARALINGGQVILADEPTGALDTRSGHDVMALLHALHARGHTIVLVTHDAAVAAHAQRVIEVSDGCIVGDRQQAGMDPPAGIASGANRMPSPGVHPVIESRWGRPAHTLRTCLAILRARPLRSALMTLGIMIGVASVILTVGVGEASRQRVLEGVNQLGTHTIELWAGRLGDTEAGRQRSLEADDARLLARQPYLQGASPVVEAIALARRGSVSALANVKGVGESYPTILGLHMQEGHWFSADAVSRRAQDVIIDVAAADLMFKSSPRLGATVMMGNVPARVIGVVAPHPSLNTWGDGKNPTIYAPYTVVTDRLTGKARFDSIVVRVGKGVASGAAEHAMLRALSMRRGLDDVYVQNADGVIQAADATASSMTILIAMVAGISLLVGGIGVMNIMLMSVAERTREIGIRMAVGARRRDILRQFLVEAALVCLLGGLAGLALAILAGPVVGWLPGGLTVIYAPWAILLTLACSCVTGLVFGYFPARRAAAMQPAQALARE